MKYEEYYKEIISLFENKIQTKDSTLYNKILNILISWYKNQYEQKIKQFFEEENELAIINITNEIKKICDYSDYDKMQETYQCKELTELNKISEEIFDSIKKSKESPIIFTESDYNNLKNKIDILELTFPKIILNKYKFIKSECLLDLEYLIKKGNVESYSFRTYYYLINN